MSGAGGAAGIPDLDTRLPREVRSGGFDDLSPFRRDWRGPVSAASGTVGAWPAEEEGGAGRRGGADHSLPPSLIHRRETGRRGWELPWVTGQSVHIQRWTQDPGRPPAQADPSRPGGSVPGAATPRTWGDGPGGGPSAGDPHVNCGVGGRGKDEGLSSAPPGGGWGWALSGCSSSCGGGRSPLELWKP